MMDRSSAEWYAIRVTYSQELKLKQYLDTLGVESFIPMRYVDKTVGEKNVRLLLPVIHNLLFVHSTRKRLDEIKSQISYMRYMIDRTTSRPMVIPLRQMEHFMAVANTLDEQLHYIESPDFRLQRGDRVRIKDGPFKGVEGIYLRIRGDRRVVVSIDGFLAVATAFIHPTMLEKVGEGKLRACNR